MLRKSDRCLVLSIIKWSCQSIFIQNIRATILHGNYTDHLLSVINIIEDVIFIKWIQSDTFLLLSSPGKAGLNIGQILPIEYSSILRKEKYRKIEKKSFSLQKYIQVQRFPIFRQVYLINVSQLTMLILWHPMLSWLEAKTQIHQLYTCLFVHNKVYLVLCLITLIAKSIEFCSWFDRNLHTF